jgi:hypothetical protein
MVIIANQLQVVRWPQSLIRRPGIIPMYSVELNGMDNSGDDVKARELRITRIKNIIAGLVIVCFVLFGIAWAAYSYFNPCVGKRFADALFVAPAQTKVSYHVSPLTVIEPSKLKFSTRLFSTLKSYRMFLVVGAMVLTMAVVGVILFFSLRANQSELPTIADEAAVVGEGALQDPQDRPLSVPAIIGIVIGILISIILLSWGSWRLYSYCTNTLEIVDPNIDKIVVKEDVDPNTGKKGVKGEEYVDPNIGKKVVEEGKGVDPETGDLDDDIDIEIDSDDENTILAFHTPSDWENEE